MPTFSGNIELRKEGVQDADPASHARRQAMLHGVRLSAFCGNVWPDSDDGLSSIVTEQVLTELIFFSVHARRYMEFRNRKTVQSDGPLLKINLPQYRYEMNVWTAVNRIVHGEKIEVHSVNPDPEKHENLGDRTIATVTITSAQRDTIAVCPQGLFYGFARQL